MSLIKNKKAFEFTFGWLFAMLVGAVILFLAIYATINLVETFRFRHETETAKQIGTLLYPVETNLESAKSAKILVPTEPRLQNTCESVGDFGKQKISILESSGIGGKWRSPDSAQVASTFQNKYLFSSEDSDAKKEFYILSKPFNFPFKITDIQILWADTEFYCFANAPQEIKKEFTELKLKNVYFNSSKAQCRPDSTIVCFTESNCDINVDISRKLVTKDSQQLYFDFSFASDRNALLYAAIFSPPEIYNCQIQRLIQRATHLADIYIKKSEFYKTRGCGSEIIPGILTQYKNTAIKEIAEETPDIRKLRSVSEDLEDKNEFLSQKCTLF